MLITVSLMQIWKISDLDFYKYEYLYPEELITASITIYSGSDIDIINLNSKIEIKFSIGNGDKYLLCSDVRCNHFFRQQNKYFLDIKFPYNSL